MALTKAQYQKNWYERHKQQHIKNVAERRAKVVAENKQNIINYLKEHPCVDCGEDDIVVLQFDHEKDKVLAVTSMMAYCWKSILREIKKCKVRCANCHVRRTASQFNWHRAKM